MTETAQRRQRPSRLPPARDMDTTPFAAILSDLLARVPGAYACSLVDREGECVDYAGLASPFDVKIAAAHSRIVMQHLEDYGALGTPRWMIVRGERKSIVAHQLPDGYALVVLLRRRAGFAPSHRAFATCERELAAEAAWAFDAKRWGVWYPVAVDVNRRGRPQRLVPTGTPLEILGALVGLPRGEAGFRVRTPAGIELTLVREARRCWYADEPITPSGTLQPR